MATNMCFMIRWATAMDLFLIKQLNIGSRMPNQCLVNSQTLRGIRTTEKTHEELDKQPAHEHRMPPIASQ